MSSVTGEPIEPQFVYWSLVFLVALVGGAWRAIGMRGRVNETWADRVAILKTGLVEGAVRELRELRARIDELLGSEGDVYEWTTADPATLLQSVRKFERLNRVLRRVPRHFKWLLRLGNIVVVSLVNMGLGVIVLGLQLSNVFRVQYQFILGAVLLGVGVLVGVACFVMYWLLENKLSGAEMLAQSVAE